MIEPIRRKCSAIATASAAPSSGSVAVTLKPTSPPRSSPAPERRRCGQDPVARSALQGFRCHESLGEAIAQVKAWTRRPRAAFRHARIVAVRTPAVDGSAGAQDTTLKVRAPNFFRFNGDGAMWNAGLGDLAYNKLHWKTAAVVADDYSFAWTSAAGFIAEFAGGSGRVYDETFVRHWDTWATPGTRSMRTA